MGSGLRTLAVSAAVAAALVGCRGGDSDSKRDDGWTGYAPARDPAAVPCSSDANPIRERQVRRTLRDHGFDVWPDGSGLCPEGVAAFLDSRPQDFAEDGTVSCLLYTEPPADAPEIVARRGADGADAELRLRNLTCTIFTDSPTGEEKIDRLEAAFAELERAIRP